MKILDNYKEVLNKSVECVDTLFDKEEINELTVTKEALVTELKNNSFIRVPFVGDFSAGKSSLLNAIIGEDELLPTDFLPTTAVSYELHYCENKEGEKIIKYNLTKETTEEYTLDKLKDLELSSGDIIELYLFNNIVKKYYDKNIILVDMPGIDSGYEAHQKAIFNYLEKGTVFVIVNDIEFGNLRNSTLNFIKEIDKYNLESLVVLSKTDKKLPEEGDKIVSFIRNQVKTILNKDYKVVKVSAFDNEIADVTSFIDKLDSEVLFQEKYKTHIVDFVDLLISKLTLRKQFLCQSGADIETKIRSLENQKKEVSQDLQKSISNLPSITEQVADVLNQMKVEVLLNSNELAGLLFEGKGEEVKERVISIVRPILIDFTNSKSLELDGFFTSTLDGFDQKLNEMLASDGSGSKVSFFNNSMVNSVPLSFSKGGAKFVSKVFSKGTLVKAGRFLASTGGIIVLAAAAAVSVATYFFRKDKKETQQINDKENVKKEFKNSVVDSMLGELRDVVTQALTELQDSKKAGFVNQTNSALQVIQTEILDVVQEREKEEFNIEKEIEKIDLSINELEQLKQKM